jgi:hypothetical protein
VRGGFQPQRDRQGAGSAESSGLDRSCSLPLTRIKALVVSSTYIVGQSEGTAMSSRFDEAERLRERARLLRESASKVSLVTDKEGCLRWPRAMN